jgi:hypothetical protein
MTTKSIESQIYNLLTTTQLSYSEIGSKVGLSGPTVSKRARGLVEAYFFNPSILRISGKKPPKSYAKYCHNLVCHQLYYVSAAQARKNGPFYCSKHCHHPYNFIPPKALLEKEYAKFSLKEIAEHNKVSLGVLVRLLETYNIAPKDFPENCLVDLAHIAGQRTHKQKARQNFKGRSRSGHREHLGFAVRSSWENNFCLYLNHKGTKFIFEPTTYYFPELRGARGYLPDFEIHIGKRVIICEVKGYLDSNDRTKMKRLKKHHPEVFAKMTYLCSKKGSKTDLFYRSLGLEPYDGLYYDDLTREYGHKLANWE